MEEKKLVILDANSILYRAFYALPKLTTRKKERTEAIYGFSLVLFKIIKEIKPRFLCACFDFPAKTFRHKEFKDYKITRPPTPEELKGQIKKTKEFLKAFKIPYFEKEGYEADDIIATIANKTKGVPKIIVSGDQDLFQIVNQETKIYFLQRGIKSTLFIDEKKVAEKFGGLLPKQIPDFKALCGDPSDNIPGAKGIGEKTAIDLIKKFESLEGIYQNLEKIQPKLREVLIKEKEAIFFSRMLVKTKQDVEINFSLENCQFGKYQKGEVKKFFETLEFKSLIKRLEEINGGLKNENLKLWQKKLF
jgi:DNA polymerase-1